MPGDRVRAEVNPHLLSGLRTASRCAGAAVALLGALVLLGWALDWPLVKSLHPDWVTMKANTAFAFLLAGASLRILGADQAPQPLRRFAHAGACLVALIGGSPSRNTCSGGTSGLTSCSPRNRRE